MRNLDILKHTFNVDSNVTIGVIASFDPSTLLPPPTSLNVIYVVNSSSIPSPVTIFDGILQQPISTLFSSQSTDPPHDRGNYGS